MPTIQQFALAIQKHEGWFLNSRSQKNNNPGNLKFAGQRKATGKDNGGFAIFNSYEDGFAALLNQINIGLSGKSKLYYPEMTLIEFFSRYAPSSDNNNPTGYAEAVAIDMGITAGFQIKDLSTETNQKEAQTIELRIAGKVVYNQEL